MMNKLQVQILAYKPSSVAPWVRIIFADRIWAIFGDSESEVVNPDAEPMDITKDLDFIQGYEIVKVNVYEV